MGSSKDLPIEYLQTSNPISNAIGNSTPPSQSTGIPNLPSLNSPARGPAAQPPLDLSIPALPRPNFDLKRDGCVMSPDQIDNLRRQISVYSTICQQLVAMFRAMTSVPGIQFSHLCFVSKTPPDNKGACCL